MKFQLRLPPFISSSVKAEPADNRPVLDGSDVTTANRWGLPVHTVALIGRPAVWFSIALATPTIPLGFATLASRRLVWEQDFGGHLFIAVTGADPSRVVIIEAGPMHPNGTGALVPFSYPEGDFEERGIDDFDPVIIEPPHGLTEEAFARLVLEMHRAYDGNQRYRAIEIPFFLVGRDSNSYVVGILLGCGIDARAIPKVTKPQRAIRWEWTGYPGMKDPVHLGNFGVYQGAPGSPEPNATDVAYHRADGDVAFVVVGGSPNEAVRLPDGGDAVLDDDGRMVFSAADARRRGLPTRHTEPPEHIRNRPRFPAVPSDAGAETTLIVNGRSMPFVPGTEYRGTIVHRDDALGLATLRTDSADIVLPLVELGVELRDPKRVDRLLHVGNELTLGLHRDRHPKLTTHGMSRFTDRPHRMHAPRPVSAAVAAALGLGGAAVLAAVLWRRAM